MNVRLPVIELPGRVRRIKTQKVLSFLPFNSDLFFFSSLQPPFHAIVIPTTTLGQVPQGGGAILTPLFSILFLRPNSELLLH